MNNERYNQIIDEVYRNYANNHFTPPKNPNSKLLAPQLWSVTPMQHNKESFIHEIKTNPKFSKKWGLKIEKRELTWEAQVQWVMKNTDVEWENLYIVEEIAKDTTPKRLLTVTYKDEKIEIYE